MFPADVALGGRPAALLIGIGLGLALVSFSIGAVPLAAQDEDDVLDYAATAPTDPVARLSEQIAAGEKTLTFEPGHGYLESLLASLDVPMSSQGLVFSRTSLQVDRISPWTPRAVYFGDDVYVGWVQGGPVIEIASVDPRLGAVFYTLRQQPGETPRFERQTTTCLMCHDSSTITGGVPGFILRSVYTDRYGYVVTSLRDGPTTDRTPLSDRWGGWYVTGTHGTATHAGNVMAKDLVHEIGNVEHYMSRVDLAAGGNVTDLKDRVDTRPYLSPTSDIVALLVLAHQATVHNLVTRAGTEARKALHDEKLLSGVADDGRGEHLPLTRKRIEQASEPLVRAMLFSRQAPLGAPIRGTSAFAAEFSRRGPRDRAGRSLRDLDLETRLFRYPLSFLIYSESFEALPALVKEVVYRRIREVLTGADTSPEFAHLSPADRGAILEILEDTRPDFPAHAE